MSEPRYHLTVTVEEPNEQYEAELQKQRDRQMYGNPYETPMPYRTMNTLDVRLTSDQFEAVMRAVLETFK